MKGNFDACLKLVLAHEGGFVNHPSDPGGMTNLGVTKRVWEDYTKRPADEAEMRALTPERVAPLYRAFYWDVCRGDDLPAGVDYAVFDTAVNSGPGRAGKLLQRTLGVADDGRIGPGTLGAAQKADVKDLIDKMCDNRLAFLQALQTWKVFGKGWGKRVADVKKKALEMAGDPT